MEALSETIQNTGTGRRPAVGIYDKDTQANLLKMKAESENARQGTLDGIDCPICRNKGYVVKIVDGDLYTPECECMKNRRTMRRIQRAGLMDLVRRYDFKSFLPTEPWQREMKNAAERYIHEGDGKWLYISGVPGSGKTHLCVATVSYMLKNRGIEARYFLWRTDAPKMKAMVNDDRGTYEKMMRDYATVDVLYIDDFFKGKVTDADINLAFEMLNARYNNTALRTIISSEIPIEDILSIDEGLGSRIYERSRDFNLAMPKKNQRLKKN